MLWRAEGVLAVPGSTSLSIGFVAWHLCRAPGARVLQRCNWFVANADNHVDAVRYRPGW